MKGGAGGVDGPAARLPAAAAPRGVRPPGDLARRQGPEAGVSARPGPGPPGVRPQNTSACRIAARKAIERVAYVRRPHRPRGMTATPGRFAGNTRVTFHHEDSKTPRTVTRRL